MKFCVQLNPQVALKKSPKSLLPTLVEQVRVADAVGFDALKRAAKVGDGWLIGPNSAIEELERQVGIFREAWRSEGKPGLPEMPIIRESFVAPTKREAIEKARPCLEQLYRHIYLQWKQNEAMSNPEELRWDFDRLAKNRFILGPPEECIDQIRQYENCLSITWMLVRFDWTPGLGQDEILASMRLFGEKVISRI